VKWYGYPTCYTVWKPEAFTDMTFTIGDQFVLTPNETFADATCATNSVPAKMAFPAHSAPLDAAFNKDFSSLYVTFHGSWNRNPATGYKIVEVPFSKSAADGAFGPKSTIAQSNTTGFSSILYNGDEEHCSTTQCFRPVSIAEDTFGRLYVTSDSGAEGEILLLGKA
jgi:glucose/arabinose dehydrogenase